MLVLNADGYAAGAGATEAGAVRYYHTPVLVAEVLKALAVRPGGAYIDATVGEGGHSQAILEASAPDGRLLGIDADPEAVLVAGKRLMGYGSRCVLVCDNFRHLGELARAHGFGAPDGVLFDLGLSSLQLEGERRGFSFQQDAPPDMRFSPSQELTADRVVNTYGERELADILTRYGEEPQARRIARAIVRRRPIRSSLELAKLVEEAVGGRRGRIHPATRTFLALRIAVNDELGSLQEALEQVIQLLRPGGKLAVISYHSLEDRLVKATLRQAAAVCICPPGTPMCVCHHQPELRLVTRKPIVPSPEEVRENPRSRSAHLRVAERC